MLMVQLESDSDWLKCGRQKSTVAQVLRGPMTPSEIWRAAQSVTPRIQLRDVWFILRQMERRKLITCFNPKERTGKVYYWSGMRPFGFSSVNWQNYAYVVRAKVRRLVLLSLIHRPDQPASRIRRGLNERQPVSLNSVIRALRDLRSFKLIKISGEGDKRHQKLYRLTPSGRRIASLLTRGTFRMDSPQSLLNPAGSSQP
jgi:Fe2+ or Zn2+ uptake regulation protein